MCRPGNVRLCCKTALISNYHHTEKNPKEISLQLRTGVPLFLNSSRLWKTNLRETAKIHVHLLPLSSIVTICLTPHPLAPCIVTSQTPLPAHRNHHATCLHGRQHERSNWVFPDWHPHHSNYPNILISTRAQEMRDVDQVGAILHWLGNSGVGGVHSALTPVAIHHASWSLCVHALCTLYSVQNPPCLVICVYTMSSVPRSCAACTMYNIHPALCKMYKIYFTSAVHRVHCAC